MRLRVVVPVFVIGALTLGVALWSSRPTGSAPPEAPLVTTTEAADQAATVAPVPSSSEAALMEAAAPPPGAAEHGTYVAERCAELADLAMDDKSESLASILEELTSRDPEIREAALNAAVQFGSRDAIPRLLDAVSQTDDEEEKVALLQAVRFLKLPTLSELAEQMKTNPPAAKP